MQARIPQLNRRDALGRLAFGTALLAAPLRAVTAQIATLPSRDLLPSDPDAYWSRIRREQFLLPKDRIFLNNGSLGVTPRPVLACIFHKPSCGLRSPEGVRWIFGEIQVNSGSDSCAGSQGRLTTVREPISHPKPPILYTPLVLFQLLA